MTARRLILLPLAGLIAGCATSPASWPVPPDPPVQWPGPPDPPRVRFLGELTRSEDIGPRKSMIDAWREVLYGPAPGSSLAAPQAVAVHPDGHRIAIADTQGACVHVFDLERRTYELRAVCGPGDEPMTSPVAVAWVEDALWFADSGRPAVGILRADGHGRWIAEGQVERPAGMAYCPLNQRCYVADARRHRVLVFRPDGTLASQFGSAGSEPGQFHYPSHVACAPDGTVIVSDSLNFRIQRFSPDGAPLGMFGRKGDAAGDLALPKGVGVDPDGHVWVVDAHFENVQAFTPEGQLLMALGEEGHAPGEFSLPAGIYIDARRRMWVADTYNRRVQVFELLP